MLKRGLTGTFLLFEKKRKKEEKEEGPFHQEVEEGKKEGRLAALTKDFGNILMFSSTTLVFFFF
jgi:hypothetical protein